MSQSLAQRFWEKVNFEGPWSQLAPDRCWLWTANLDHRGYGRFRVGKTKPVAHRVAYELAVGDIPEGMKLDRLCRTRACVRPSHLEPVLHKENCARSTATEVNRARNLARTACKRGHPYTPETTKLNSAGARRCTVCMADWPSRQRKRVAA